MALTATDFDGAFGAYFDEIGRCRANKCYWALLHLVIVLPDVCSALEASDGIARPSQYKAWSQNFLQNIPLNGDELYYDIRCRILHQGITDKQKSTNYTSYSYSQPGPTDGRPHLDKDLNGDLRIDVDKLANEIIAAFNRWKQFMLANPALKAAKNVESNLPNIARPQLIQVQSQVAGSSLYVPFQPTMPGLPPGGIGSSNVTK